MPLLRRHTDWLMRRISPAHRLERKHEAELSFWRDSLQQLDQWFNHGAVGKTGIRPPDAHQKLNVSKSWITNAVMTRHAMCPSYTERLRIERNVFHGQRVLEIGCGPLAPILQFEGCFRHCIDPLVNVYMAAGWPLFDYDAKFINTGGETLPYPDAYFDSVISVNALDHVDDFEQTASEIQRVLRSGGKAYFEVEYHKATVTEPVELEELRVRQAFRECELKIVVDRTGREMYDAMVKKFDLLPFNFQHFHGRFSAWHATRI